MRTIRQLDPVEIRLLGTLLEKERTTPEAYPLTVRGLLTAANQKTNRDPVTRLTEEEVLDALDRLRRDVLAWRSEGARAERWSQSISRRLELDRAGRAVLTLLMLRGPQTPGELRGRSGRLHDFASLDEVEEALEAMAAGPRPLVAELPRQAGQKETRWTHLLGEPVGTEAAIAPGAASAVPGAGPRAAPPPLTVVPAPAGTRGAATGTATAGAGGTAVADLRVAAGSAPSGPADPEMPDRLALLEARVDELAAEVARLRRRLGGEGPGETRGSGEGE